MEDSVMVIKKGIKPVTFKSLNVGDEFFIPIANLGSRAINQHGSHGILRYKKLNTQYAKCVGQMNYGNGDTTGLEVKFTSDHKVMFKED